MHIYFILVINESYYFIMIQAKSWTDNRRLLMARRLKSMKSGDAYYSQSRDIKIVYIFKGSKIPHFIIYHKNKKIYPEKRKPVEKLEDVLEFILKFNKTDTYYIPSDDMVYQENGGMSYMQYFSSR